MLTQPVVLENILSCLRELAPAATDIHPDSDLVNDLGIESIKMMDLLMILEDKYDISIPINILMDVRTPKQLAVSLMGYAESCHGTV